MITQHITESYLAKQPLLSVDNRTTIGAVLPTIDVTNPRQYVGYFQNAFGEQWVFVGDSERHTAQFWGGDLDWDNPGALKITVTEEAHPIQVILNDPEILWIKACLATVGLDEVAKNEQLFPCLKMRS